MLQLIEETSQRKRFKVASSFDDLEAVVEETEAFFAARLEDSELVYKVVLLTSEAVTNAIEHGNALDADREVEICFEVTDASAEVSVEDEGSGFNPNQVESPLDEEHLYLDGGRGVYLMREMADELHFDLDGRRVRMVFNV